MDPPAPPPPLPSEIPPAPAGPLPPRGAWSAFLLGVAGTVVLLTAQALAAMLFAGVRAFQFVVDHHRSLSTSAVERLASDPALIAFCVFASLPVIWLALYGMVRVQRGGRFLAFLGLRGFRWTQLLIWFPLLAVVLLGSTALLRWLGADGAPDFTLNLLLENQALSGIVAAIVIGAPLVEEPLFRGFMYQGMARSRWTTLAALLVPNCLWVLLHVQYQWPSLIVLFLVGLVFALSRHFSGSTLLPILLHFGLNTFAVLGALFLLHPTGPHGIDLSRDTVLASMMKAKAAQKADDTTDAIDAYTAALALDPKNEAALEQRGLLHQSNDNFPAAIADFTTLLPLTSTPARIRYLRARARDLNDNESGALADLDQAVSLDPRAYRAYSLRASIHGRRGSLDLAIADGKAALRVNPDFIPAIRNLGTAYYNRYDYDLAIAQFNHALELSPQSARDHVSRGVAYGDKGEPDRAITDFSAAIRLSPHYAMAYCDRGYAWQQKREYRKAYVDLTTALEIDPDHSVAANVLAWLLATCPDPIFRDGPEAVRYAEQACRATHWKNPAFLDTLAAAYAEHGDWDKAIWWQERVLEYPKPDKGAQGRLDRYRNHQAFTEP